MAAVFSAAVKVLQVVVYQFELESRMLVSASVGSEAQRAFEAVKRWFIAIGIFSALVNILMLTGAIYMLQVYDRVLSSQSIPTLVALSLLALLAFGVQGYLESVRSRMLVNIGAAYEVALAPAVFNAVSALALGGFGSAQAVQPTRDVERVRGFLSGLGPTAILDMPFMPVFLAGCFILHPWLGWLAFAGSVLIVLLTVIAEYVTRSEIKTAMTLSHHRTSMLEASRRNSEAITAMGFRGVMRHRWLEANAAALAPGAKASSRTAALGAFAKTFRFILQSAVLGLGAYLATKQEISSGAIIAASIMMSRALAPIEVAIGHWRNFSAARESHMRLIKMLAVGDLGRGKTSLPAPRKMLAVENLIVVPPGTDKPIVKGVSFELAAGSALAVFGPSAAGKSTMSRALVSVWPAASGSVRLDGAPITQYPEDEIGMHIGYLPQDVELLDGTVGENIARFDPDAKPEDIVNAAIEAGAHELILRLPKGYDTQIGESGTRLSGGQRQRIALARALYKDPFLVVLDEPNSNLDGSGDEALNDAIMSVRKRGGVVVVISHRTATLASVNYIAIMNDGHFEQFGTKDQMAPKMVAGKPAPQQGKSKSPPLASAHR